MISRWTSEEISILFHAVAEYGKDCKIIADIMGSKNENTVKSFFAMHGDRYHMNEIANEFYENNPYTFKPNSAD